MDGGAWQAIVHGVTKSRTQLSDFGFTINNCMPIKWQPRRNGQIRKVQSPQTEPGRTENRYRPITSTEIEAMINNLLTNQGPVPDGVTGDFYQTCREELTPICLKLLQKVACEGKLPNSSYEVTIALTEKPDKDTTKRKLQTDITDKHRCKRPQQNTSHLYPKIH